MGALVGLCFGVGVLLIITPPGPRHGPSSLHRPVRNLQELISRAGLEGTRPSRIGALCAVTGLLACAVVAAITGVLIIGLVLGVLAAFAPVTVLSAKAHRRQREFAEAWPDAVDHLASAIRAGLSLPESLIQLGERGPAQLRPAFVQFGKDYQSTGRFSPSLDALKERLADPIGDRVVEALRIAREVGGGDLGRMLRTLSAFLRDELRTRGELEARQSWTVSGARLAVAAPWLVLLLMSSQRDVIGRFAEPTGMVLISSGAVICVVAYWLMIRLGRLPNERRILA